MACDVSLDDRGGGGHLNGTVSCRGVLGQVLVFSGEEEGIVEGMEQWLLAAGPG